ncbi:hypothetical protein ACWGKW_29780 [Streptomyces sp. NPDC054766]
MSDQPAVTAEDDGTSVVLPSESAPDDSAQDSDVAVPVPVDSAAARSGDDGSPSDTLPPPFGT